MSTCPNCGLTAEESFNFCPSCGTRAAEVGAEGKSLLGRTLNDKYRLEEEIGHGSMGTVYLAEHIGLRKKVALKVLHPDLQLGDDALVRFQREGIAAGKFTHPNAIQIFDFDREGSRIFYLAMEYVDGKSLKQYVREHAPVDPREAVKIVRQVLQALAEAHLHGIVHRDLKPDNIMVQTGAGGALNVKVLDFGLSKLVDRAAGASLATQTGMILGTPLYMSPEQCAGEPADVRSDVYATGLILYELLAGALPFKGEAVSEILLERASTEARPIVEVRPDLGVPPDLDQVLRRALQHDRKKRFQGAQEMIAALDAIRYDGKAAPRPARRGEETAATVRISPDGAAPSRGGGRKAAVGVVVALALIAAVVFGRRFLPGAGADAAPTRVSQKAADERTEPERRYLDLVSRARDQLASRRPQDALTAIESALRLPCRDAEGLHVRGLVFRARRDFDTALVDFEDASRLDPTYAAPHAGRGWVALDRGDLDGALAAFDQAFEVDPSHADALTGRGAVLWRRGEVDAARAELERAVSLSDGDALALYYLGRIRIATGDTEGAIEALIRSKRADARAWRTLAALGEAYVGAGRPEEAEQQLRAALDEHPEAVEAAETLAVLLIDQVRFGEAITLLEKTIGLRDVASLHVLQGLALRGQGNVDGALAALERGIARDRSNVDARLLLGILYQQSGRLDDASAEYRAVLDEDDSRVRAHLNLGLILMERDEPEAAIAQLERAVGRDPDLIEGHRTLGVLYMDWVIDHQRAGDHFRRVLDLGGNDSQVRGWLRKMGQKP